MVHTSISPTFDCQDLSSSEELEISLGTHGSDVTSL